MASNTREGFNEDGICNICGRQEFLHFEEKIVDCPNNFNCPSLGKNTKNDSIYLSGDVSIQRMTDTEYSVAVSNSRSNTYINFFIENFMLKCCVDKCKGSSGGN